MNTNEGGMTDEQMSAAVDAELNGQAPVTTDPPAPKPDAAKPAPDAGKPAETKPETKPEVSKPNTEAKPDDVPETDDDLDKDTTKSEYAKKMEKARRSDARAAKRQKILNDERAAFEADRKKFEEEKKKAAETTDKTKNTKKPLDDFTVEELEEIIEGWKDEADKAGKDSPLGKQKLELVKAAKDKIAQMKEAKKKGDEEAQKTYAARLDTDHQHYLDQAKKEFPELADQKSELYQETNKIYQKVREDLKPYGSFFPPPFQYYIADYAKAKQDQASVSGLQKKVEEQDKEIRRLKGDKSLPGSTVNGKPSAPRKDSELSDDEMRAEVDRELMETQKHIRQQPILAA